MNTQPCKNQSKSSSAAVIKHLNVLFLEIYILESNIWPLL